MKKILSLTLCIIVLLSTCACNNAVNNESTIEETSYVTIIDGEDTTSTVTGNSSDKTETSADKTNNDKKQDDSNSEMIEPNCKHDYSKAVTVAATCSKEGSKTKTCKKCGYKNIEKIEKKSHTYTNATCTKPKTCSVCGATSGKPLEHNYSNNVCVNCKQVKSSSSYIELGIPTTSTYGIGSDANGAWDLKIFNGKIYRGGGNYSNNTGDTPIWAYDIKQQNWVLTGTAEDEAIQRFIEIDGTLYTPGIDATATGWSKGNFYYLYKNTWVKMRTIPNGIHVYDIAKYDGKLFIGTATEDVHTALYYTTDGGNTFTHVKIYDKDGSLYPVPAGHDYTRVYELVNYKGTLYALVGFYNNTTKKTKYHFFVYKNNRLEYLADAASYTQYSLVSYNKFSDKVIFNDACYIAARNLYAVTDFTASAESQKIQIPNDASVADVLVKNGVLYVLARENKSDGTFETIIYKSTTGKEGGFQKVTSFSYSIMPNSFETEDGKVFYVNMGYVSDKSKNEKNGMLIQISANS